MRKLWFAFILLLSTPLSAAEKTLHFDADAAGQLPKDFSALSGSWKIFAEAGTPSGGQALAQTAKNERSVFNLVLLNDLKLADVDVSVKFKSIGGEDDQGGGVVWRYKDEKNYYVARFNPLETNFRLYHILAGKRTQLKEAKLSLGAGWHSLRVSMAGEAITCYLDGAKQIEATDGTFKDAGQVGLWTKADAHTAFDDLSVSGK